MAKKIQMMSHDKEWQIVNGVETLVPVEQIDIDPITDSSAVQIEGHRTLEETLATKHQMTPEIDETKIMSKVGGVYHQNVVDGAYEEAILYGNSKVNLMEDDTTTAQPIPLTFTSFNNGLQKELALGNNTVAPMLKGATLINRALTNSVTLASGEKFYIHNLKGNTIHTVSFKFTTKNTNAGVVIESCTGETYLENSMHKTGLGDNVIFTVTTHANADSIAIVNNAAYGGETIKLDDIMVIEGDQTLMDLTFFKGMRSVELVKPLTNLFTNDLQYYSSQTTATNSNGNVTVTSTASSSWTMSQYYLSSLKPNTKYLVMWDSLTTTQTSTTQQEILICVVDITNNVKLGGINEDSKCPTKRSIIFDTGSRDLSQIVFRVHATMSNTETGTTTVKGLRVFEWDDATSRALDLQSIGYFSGTKNVSIPNFKTNSKNLYPYGDVNFTPTVAAGWYDAKGNGDMYGDIAQKSKARFLLRKGSYILSYVGATNVSAIGFAKDNGDVLWSPMTLTQDTYVTLVVKTTQANVVTTVTNIQIERGDTATSYVSYDTRQYKPDNQEVVVLRSLPNGVCDTFNLQTGEYVQRIGEVVLDGSDDEDWILLTSEPWTENGYYTFECLVQPNGLPTYDDNNGIYAICDKFNSITYSVARTDVTGVLLFNSRGRKVGIKQKECTTLDEWKQYLQSNPLTVQYQLSEPIIKQIPIINNVYTASNKVNFKESKNADFRCFGNPTYLEVGSLSPVNSIVQPITNIPLNVRLKANTSYTVRLDRTGSSLNIDLGGTTVTTSNSTDNEFIIKTPTGMLSHNQIRFSGNGSIGRVMVFEGDIRGIELPYFMGINNVKMPIVRNCGKNLFDGEVEIGGITNETGLLNNKTELVRSKNPICVNGNTTYILSNDKNYNNYVYFYSNDDRFISYLAGRENPFRFTTPSNTHHVRIRTTEAESQKDLTIKWQLEESSIATSYEPYRGNDICLVQGEIGLSLDMFEQGGISYHTLSDNMVVKTYEQCKGNSSTRLRNKTIFKINGGKTYKLTLNDSSKRFQWYLWGQDGKNLGVTGGWSNTSNTFIVTVPQEAAYMSLMFKKTNDSTITVDELNLEYFQLLELDSTVQLRSLPNGVKDELNLLTGEYIQRVGEVVLDGKNNQFIEGLKEQKGDYLKFGMQLNPVAPYNHNVYLLNDRFNSETYSTSKEGQQEQIYIHAHSSTNTELRVCILPSKLSTPDNVGFNSYLQSNPITVQYELAEPIISYPRIVSNTQEREVGVKLPNGVCDTYNPSTGVTVKRVGKIVLDGSEDWEIGTTKTNTQVFELVVNDLDARTNSNNLVCDSLPINNGDGSDIEKIASTSSTGANNSSSSLYIALLKTKASTVSELKIYLASNPITVWYELKNPIITTDIVLPNGVHDEYNPLTGLYTKRVGFIELDGSETWKFGTTKTNTQVFELIMSKEKLDLLRLKNNIICDKLPTTNDDGSDTEKIAYSDSYVDNATTMSIYIALLKTKASTLNELKTYLSQNPLKVWYELSTPITYQLTPYFGLPMPYAYKDGYLIMDSAYDGQTLPPEIKYKLLANRTGQITQNNIKLQNHTSKLSNLEAMLIEATLQSMYEREMMAFNLEMVNINLINLEE